MNVMKNSTGIILAMKRVLFFLGRFGLWVEIILLFGGAISLMLATRCEPWYRLVNPEYWILRVQGKDLFDQSGVLWHGNRNRPEIALTFDDGPDPVYTDRVLDALKRANMKATFFLVAKNIKSNPESAKRIIKRILAEGHDIGCHSYDHQRMPTLTYDQQWRQLRDSNVILAQTVGRQYHLYRSPYGDWNNDTLRAAQAHRMILVNWTVGGDSYYNYEMTSHYVGKILRHTGKGSILLLHDRGNHHLTAERLDQLLNGIKERGLTSVTLSQLLGKLPQRAKWNFNFETLRILGSRRDANSNDYCSRRRGTSRT